MAKRRQIDPTLTKETEREYQRRIDKRARALGAITCHVHKARMVSGNWITPTSDAGFPDLWCLFPTGRLVVFEVKKEDAPPSKFAERQRLWVKRLQAVPGVDSYCVRPSDWPHVEALLVEASTDPGPIRPDALVLIDNIDEAVVIGVDLPYVAVRWSHEEHRAFVHVDRVSASSAA